MTFAWARVALASVGLGLLAAPLPAQAGTAREAGLEAVESITPRAPLESYQLFHTVQGTLAAELGRNDAARAHFRRAEQLAALPSEREFLARRMAELE